MKSIYSLKTSIIKPFSLIALALPLAFSGCLWKKESVRPNTNGSDTSLALNLIEKDPGKEPRMDQEIDKNLNLGQNPSHHRELQSPQPLQTEEKSVGKKDNSNLAASEAVAQDAVAQSAMAPGAVASSYLAKSANKVKSESYSLGGSTGNAIARGGCMPPPRCQPMTPPQYYPSKVNEGNTEGYDVTVENDFLDAKLNPLSTFSIDVDAASYSNVRRFLTQGQLPPPDAVRTEELVNYFKYDYPQPSGKNPFTVAAEVAQCPWNAETRILAIGLQGRKIETENLAPARLTFLIDVSGSMSDENKLPLLKKAFAMLVRNLRPQDQVAITVYAGAAGIVLPPTSGANKELILSSLEQLQSGGSTAGAEGIRLAYQVARSQFQKGASNRVILATDGDFNVGVSSDGELVRIIEQECQSGVFLSLLGFGMGNYQDAKMEKLADKGNGNYAYIDNLDEARRVLVSEMGGTLFTIAKDVKLQLEFNPSKVKAYRLIGYENRMLKAEDFHNDKKDAGELGAGHTVTALYEIVPQGSKWNNGGKVDALKYQQQGGGTESPELLTVKLRYKEPDGSKSRLLEASVQDRAVELNRATENLRFATAVAQYGMLLRHSEFIGTANWDNTLQLAKNALGKDGDGRRLEFLGLCEKAKALSPLVYNGDKDAIEVEKSQKNRKQEKPVNPLQLQLEER